MPYAAQFFAEKLNVPVEYFNPFRNVQIDPSVNLEELVRVAHSMGEVVGLGLRNLAHCPVELNLMPESTRKWRAFNEKKPYLIATVFTIVAVVAVVGLLFQQLSSVKASKIEEIKPKLEQAQAKDGQFQQAFGKMKDTTNELGQLTDLMADRYYWVDTLPEFNRILTHVDMVTSNKWAAPAGIWIEQFCTPAPADVSGGDMGYSQTGGSSAAALETTIETKYELNSPQQNAGAAPGMAPAAPVPGS